MKYASIFQRINIGFSGDMTLHPAILNQSIVWGSRRLLKELMLLTMMKPQEKHTSS